MTLISNLYHKAISNLELHDYRRVVEKITQMEPWAFGLSLKEIQTQYDSIRKQSHKSVDSINVIRIFALVRAAVQKTTGIRLHDVQLMGGLALSKGRLAEMRTGEGKTLSIVAPAVLASIPGKGVHVVTSNSYLAARDAEANRAIFAVFGLTVGVAEPQSPADIKRSAYACDITYGVNYELGFDYLRDNLVRKMEDKVQRGLHFAIIDEVDSILIDEARTPLIISGLGAPNTDLIEAVDSAVRTLNFATDVLINEKTHNASLRESGYDKIEAALLSKSLITSRDNLYATNNLHILATVQASISAYALYRENRDYVIRNGEVVIVDGNTGRFMEGRRWGGGVHEAIEARAKVAIKPDTVVQATITYQSFFGLYSKISGLTGTAATEAEEFSEVYGLQTISIPTNKPVVRIDGADRLFSTKAAKWAALLAEVKERHDKKQPILIGTASVQDAEYLDSLLTRHGFAHATLSAKNQGIEAEIIAEAGKPGAITIATNMAGRGTDIVLGGHEPQVVSAREAWAADRATVINAGGLAVLGTERHESRRTDNQLRGRAGRQGDAGFSQFFISLEDMVPRVFGAQNMHSKTEGDVELTSPMFAQLLLNAQKRIEQSGFDARKDLLKFDKVLADQRNALYGLRDDLMTSDEAVEEYLTEAFCKYAVTLVGTAFTPDFDTKKWDVAGVKEQMLQLTGSSLPLIQWVYTDMLSLKEIIDKIDLVLREFIQGVLSSNTAVARALLFDALEMLWSQHLAELEKIRDGANLMTFAQINPAYSYASQAYQLFQGTLSASFEQAVLQLLQGRSATLVAKPSQEGSPSVNSSSESETRLKKVLEERWVSRNESCPCGSLLAFKKCHGRFHSTDLIGA